MELAEVGDGVIGVRVLGGLVGSGPTFATKDK